MTDQLFIPGYSFGYKPFILKGLKDGAPFAWGARLIYEVRDGVPHYDLVWDRKTMFGDSALWTGPDYRAFCDCLNYDWKEVLARARRFYDSDPAKFGPAGEGKMTLLDNHVLTIIATPNASCGYLYVAAVPKVRKKVTQKT
jgi:hypothetical protein